MDCESIRSELVALEDGELAPQARAQVESHLRDCAGCRAFRAELQRALGALDSLPATEPSAGFAPAFWRRFETEARGGVWRRWAASWLRPVPLALAGAGLAAGLLLALWLVPRAPSPASADELIIAEHLDLFADYEAIDNLDLLEDFEVIESLEDES